MVSVKNNIAFIAMPTAGKSTVGVIVAKLIGKDFIDTDLILQQRGLLRDLIARYTVKGFMQLEQDAVCALDCTNTVIATGGSVVYSQKAMKHLKEIATVVYLKVDKSIVCERLHDMEARGVIALNATNASELYDERIPLYERYADITVEEYGSAHATAVKVVNALNKESQ